MAREARRGATGLRHRGFGQNVFVDPENGIVIAKLPSQAVPLDERLISLTMRGVEAIRRHLAGS